MYCPYCGFPDQRVLESRVAREGEAIRRRRECLKCERRFTTYETFERQPLLVVKRDGSRQEFDRDKVLRSMSLAVGKRPVSECAIREAANAIERELWQEFETETTAQFIGEKVMEALQRLDTVAFIRYTSVYHSFEDPGDFMELSQAIGSRVVLEPGA